MTEVERSMKGQSLLLAVAALVLAISATASSVEFVVPMFNSIGDLFWGITYLTLPFVGMCAFSIAIINYTQWAAAEARILEGDIETTDALEEDTVIINISWDEILQATKEDEAKQMLIPYVEAKLQKAGLELTEDAKSTLVNIVFLTMKKTSQAVRAAKGMPALGE